MTARCPVRTPVECAPFELMPDRFRPKVLDASDPEACWLWTGAGARTSGYGVYRHEGRMQQAHRVAYMVLVGPIPNGLVLDHLCRVTNCVNPRHVEPVTPGENVRRGVSPSALNLGVTHCHRGHEFTAANTYYRKDKDARQCRACGRADNRRYKRRVRQRELAADPNPPLVVPRGLEQGESVLVALPDGSFVLRRVRSNRWYFHLDQGVRRIIKLPEAVVLALTPGALVYVGKPGAFVFDANFRRHRGLAA